MLTAKEKDELTILHHTDHHTAVQTERFNKLRRKATPSVSRTLSKRPVRNTELETAETWARINAKFGA